jgi:hypothetical protein
MNRVGLVLMAQDILGLIPRGTHNWRRFLRPDDMVGLMGNAGIAARHIGGVGLPPNQVPRAALAILGLAFRFFTYPHAARRIRLSTVAKAAVIYQGYGIQTGRRAGSGQGEVGDDSLEW